MIQPTPLVQCDHAATCKMDCPHREPHKTERWCDCLSRRCGSLERAICEKVKERL